MPTPEQIHCQAKSTPPTLSDVYEIDSRDGYRKAMTAVFDLVNGLMCDGKVSECDDALRTVDVGRLNYQPALSFVVASHAGRSVLPSRVDLIQRVRARLLLAMSEERMRGIMDRYSK